MLVRHARLQINAHGPASKSATAVKQEKEKGFIAEMRKVAMKLHTRDQAPKEGGQEASKTPMSAWVPTREGYLRFLTESKAVYDKLESVVDKYPAFAQFRETGLERSASLAKDIEWFRSEYGLQPPTLEEDGPGLSYARNLEELASTDPPAFICHFYNFYFAHTAGGRMIGNKVASMILDGKELAFYQWNGDVNEHLDGVRRTINLLAESWTPEQKEHCLQETSNSFKLSGGILRCISS